MVHPLHPMAHPLHPMPRPLHPTLHPPPHEPRLHQVNTGTPSGTSTAAYCVSTFLMPALVAGAMPYHRAAAIFLPRGQEDSSPWSRYNMLLVPLHIDDNHWACITIQAAIRGPTQIMQLKIYDSLSRRGGRAAAKALAATLGCKPSWKARAGKDQ